MSARVVVVDYEMGNLRSIANALRVVGGDVVTSADPDVIARADRLVLPGVGAFGASVDNLRARGLDAAIHAHVDGGRPFLGICLGFQVLFDVGLEHGEHTGLGLFRGTVRRFDTALHVPHVGWNGIQAARPHALLAGLADGTPMYFVHSYHPAQVLAAEVLATAEYDGAFCCAVARDNVAGTQFHPEKSGPDGLRLLANFLAWSV